MIEVFLLLLATSRYACRVSSRIWGRKLDVILLFGGEVVSSHAMCYVCRKKILVNYRDGTSRLKM